jgi:hypothetical protein
LIETTTTTTTNQDSNGIHSIVLTGRILSSSLSGSGVFADLGTVANVRTPVATELLLFRAATTAALLEERNTREDIIIFGLQIYT